MIDEAKVTAAIDEFMKNPEWKEVFQKAPGGAMERLAISFYFSKNKGSFTPEEFEEYRDLREEIEKSLDVEDLNYLIEKIEKPDSRDHYKQLLEKVQKRGGPEKPIEREEVTETEVTQTATDEAEEKEDQRDTKDPVPAPQEVEQTVSEQTEETKENGMEEKKKPVKLTLKAPTGKIPDAVKDLMLEKAKQRNAEAKEAMKGKETEQKPTQEQQ